jgi:aryl-phospho-beta-D-glucosidase BglC (GH1 family)
MIERTLVVAVLFGLAACSSSEEAPAALTVAAAPVADGGAGPTDGAASSEAPDASEAGTPIASLEVGLNVDGFDFNGAKLPGLPNTDFPVLDVKLLDYYLSKGIKVVRLPFLWERVQPALGGALDATYLGYLTTFVAGAATRGMRVILDVHDYGGYRGTKLGAVGGPTNANLADLWTRLSTSFVGKPGVEGYDLMNEPSGMPSPAAWPLAAQAAVDAIRKVDTKTALYVEGDFYSSAARWVEVNGALDIVDPSKNVIYSAHCYLDRDASGTHFVWAEEVKNGVTVNVGVERLTPFVGWLKLHGFRGHIGEMGVGNDDPSWNVALDNAIAFLKTSALVGVSYFAAGPWWGAYPSSAEPRAGGHDAPQMQVLVKYTGGTFVP